MKRDIELVRKILLAIEAADGRPALSQLMADGCTERDIGYHAGLRLA